MDAMSHRYTSGRYRRADVIAEVAAGARRETSRAPEPGQFLTGPFH